MITRIHALFRQRQEDGAAPRGQVLVMFALFLTSMLGMLGLATDLGFAFAEKRTIQNAVDAGAMAGARAVAKAATTGYAAAMPDVQAMATSADNRLGSTSHTVSCNYVTYGNSSLGGCGGGVPSSATGVQVEVEEQHQTFFIQVVPGAPNNLTLRARATAHVQRLTAGTDGPFIVCGEDTKLVSGGEMSILRSDGTINPSAYGQTFEVHGPQITDCNARSSSWKGLAGDAGDNTNKQRNEYWMGRGGTRAGPTRVRVNGIEGCQQGQDANNCVVLLPIAMSSPAPKKHGHDVEFYVVQIAAFRVAETAANRHSGTLLRDYIVTGPGDNNWCITCNEIAVVRMTS